MSLYNVYVEQTIGILDIVVEADTEEEARCKASNANPGCDKGEWGVDLMTLTDGVYEL